MNITTKETQKRIVDMEKVIRSLLAISNRYNICNAEGCIMCEDTLIRLAAARRAIGIAADGSDDWKERKDGKAVDK